MLSDKYSVPTLCQNGKLKRENSDVTLIKNKRGKRSSQVSNKQTKPLTGCPHVPSPEDHVTKGEISRKNIR